MTDKSYSFLGQNFTTPIVTAPMPKAWTADDLIALGKSGASVITTKSVTLEPRAGNAEPREWYGEHYSLNAVGLANDGMAAHIAYVRTAAKEIETPILFSIAGFSAAEYAKAVTMTLKEKAIWGVELNLSCPNTEANIIADDPKLVKEVLEALPWGALKEAGKQIGVKVNPTTDSAKVAAIAAVLSQFEVEYVVTSNTFGGVQTQGRITRPTAGMSGPAVLPISLTTTELYRGALPASIDIIGLGGVQTDLDVQAYLAAGANMVGLATGIMQRGVAAVSALQEANSV